MAKYRKIISCIAVIVFLTGLCPGSLRQVLADPEPVAVSVRSYSGGGLTLQWGNMPETKSVRITYHTYPDGVLSEMLLDQTTNTADITGLQNDVMYDIDVKLYDAIGGGGNEIGHGFLYFIPKITFYSTILEQDYVDIPGGGRESGVNPRLNLKWKMPRVWDGDSFEYVNGMLSHMETQINNVYGNNIEINSVNFRINISTDISKINSGSPQASIIIENGAPEYTAYVSGYEAINCDVHNMDANGYMNFDLIGRKDESVEFEAGDAEEYGLPDHDIFPGTVYYMNVKPVFENAAGNSVYAASVGAPSALNGSLLSGPVSYTYTPIRFQLSRDGFYNLYVKIYKLNQGSLDLPRLFYEVHSSDDPGIPGDWSIRKTMDDTYFVGDFAVTVLSGINPNNEIYYKIVVKSESADDRLESCAMPYILAEDTGKPPLPTNINIDERTMHTGDVEHPATHDMVSVNSTDVTISWEKPVDWDEIKDNLYYHFLLSTNPSDLEEPTDFLVDGLLWDSYVPKYRLVKYVSAMSPNIEETASRLSFTLDGFDLFMGEDDDGVSDEEIPNADDYPGFIAPNRIYYLKMYTTKEADKGSTDPEHMSDVSLIYTFTSLANIEYDVPLPYNFRVNRNEADESDQNEIELQFERIGVDWQHYGAQTGEVFYDLYMSTRTEADSFRLIGTTQSSADFGDVQWSDNILNPYIRAVVNTFSSANNPDAVTAFGTGLRSDTTYYFVIRTRLVIEEQDDRESVPTAILPITTIRVEMGEPDEDSRRPLSPVDFSIALDETGNPLLSGSSVIFRWTMQEENAVYRLMCTSRRAPGEADPGDYEDDALYVSFINQFASSDSDGDDSVFTLDPGADLEEGYFEFDEETSVFTLKIDEWLFPNRLYYFSLQAAYDEKESLWVCIPVTTMLIEEPYSIKTIKDYELSFYWSDSDQTLLAEDFSFIIKAPGGQYTSVSAAKCSIIKDGTDYYGRILGLESNISYNVRIYKGYNDSVLVEEITGLDTREGSHQIEVKWRGRNTYDYEIAVKTEEGTVYTIVPGNALKKYNDINGNIKPYYEEKTADTLGTDYSWYFARIEGLQSNSKYYIKVRSVKSEVYDTMLVTYSKYIGPVDTRTEFCQDDYNDEDRDNTKEVVFLERIEEFEEGYFWRLNISGGSGNELLLKEDRVINAITAGRGSELVIDISQHASEIGTDTVYMHGAIISTLNTQRKSISILTAGSEYTITPDTVDFSRNSQINSIRGTYNSADILFKVTISRSRKPLKTLPAGTLEASGTSSIKVEAFASVQTYDELKLYIDEKLYDKDEGLVSEKLGILTDTELGSSKDFNAQLERYIEQLIEIMEVELSGHIGYRLSTGVFSGVREEISSFDGLLGVKLLQDNAKGNIAPYACYKGSGSWQKLFGTKDNFGSSMSFFTPKAGEYLLLGQAQLLPGVSLNYPSRDILEKFLQKYDLSEVFYGINSSFAPENPVSNQELILLYEKVTGNEYSHPGSSIRQKASYYSLDRVVGSAGYLTGTTRQKTAAVIIKVYCEKTGTVQEYFSPSVSVFIRDENEIGSLYHKPVFMSVEMNMLSTDWDKNFKPNASITRAEAIVAFYKMLKLAGEF